MKRIDLGVDIAAVATQTAVEGLSPFFEGGSAIASFEFVGFTGTFLIEGSDDGTTYSTVLSSTALTLSDKSLRKEIVLKRFMRSNMTVRSAGSASAAIEGAL